MQFDSIDFGIFLPIVLILYWYFLNRNIRIQNAFIVLVSYVFYGWWDWRFLSLLIFSTVVDFAVGKGLSKEENHFKRKILLWTSLLVNLSLLGFFKYYNFFVDNFVQAFSFFGEPINVRGLDIVLPVGISFYTFQTLSYSIDVYRRKLEPTRDFVAFAAFVSFFPQLVAGPIERATHLLPQFYSKRVFDERKVVDGFRQILWGVFKKMVVADNCAGFANAIFNDSTNYSGYTLFLGAFFFAFQIYGDFSGYSDIAIGTSRLMGFELMKNFSFPYFSRDIAEFWRRWHISLSTWFRDYLYIPLGGSKGGVWMKVRNTFAIFIISGFWHGANWTFVIWGALNAAYFLPGLLLNRNRLHLDVVAQGKLLPSLKEMSSMTFTFLGTVFAWIFFRATDVGHAVDYITSMISGFTQLSSLEQAKVFIIEEVRLSRLTLILLFIVIEWIGRENNYAIENVGLNWPKPIRWSFYYLVIFITILYSGDEQQFIYFQF